MTAAVAHEARAHNALASFAARYGHRIASGVCPEPGAHSAAPAWWSAADWAGVEVWANLAARPDVAKDVKAAPATIARVAAAMARYADRRTGRDCRPTNERLAVDLGMSVRQIQRARDALKRLGLVVELVRGRSIMTRSERLAAWRRGSSHRNIAAVFALVSRRERPLTSVSYPQNIAGYPQSTVPLVERVTPPGEARVCSSTSVDTWFLHGNRPTTDEGAPPLTHRRSGYRPDSRARNLIVAVKGRIPWLRPVSARRLACLNRFAVAGWTARDVQTACDEVLRARGWRVPTDLATPAAYLAALVRDLDPADRPGALEAARLAEERARREWVWQTSYGPDCTHGQPGGNLPHPVTGHFSCLDCRTTNHREDTR